MGIANPPAVPEGDMTGSAFASVASIPTVKEPARGDRQQAQQGLSSVRSPCFLGWSFPCICNPWTRPASQEPSKSEDKTTEYGKLNSWVPTTGGRTPAELNDNNNHPLTPIATVVRIPRFLECNPSALPIFGHEYHVACVWNQAGFEGAPSSAVCPTLLKLGRQV